MILRPYERTIFKRYLLPQRGEGFIFVAAAFSFTAVMLGVAALVVVMSVMNGVRSDLFDKIVGLNGHAVVQGFGGRIDDWKDVLKEAKATPGVVSATPLIEQPLLATFSGRVEGVLVRGMTVPDIRSNKTLGGKVHLSVSATNNSDTKVDVTVSTPYGDKKIKNVKPGKSVTLSINTKTASVPAGQATVTVTGTIDGEEITETKTAPYTAYPAAP